MSNGDDIKSGGFGSLGPGAEVDAYDMALAADAGYQFPPGHDPIIPSTGPITPSQYPDTFQNQNISKMSNDALLAAYGAALEELNGVRSTRNMARVGYEGINTYFDDLAKAEATWEAIKAAISAKGLEMPTGTFTENVNAAGRTVGGWMDRIFDYLGIPRPDYAVAQPGPGGTLVWGSPQGTVFSRIGTTPGGTITGVQTGIPALDRVLSNVADILTGRVEVGDILNAETIEQMVIDAATDELGVDAGTITIADIKAAVDAVSAAPADGTQVTVGTATAGQDTVPGDGQDTVPAVGTVPAVDTGTTAVGTDTVPAVGTVPAVDTGTTAVDTVVGGVGALDVTGGIGGTDVTGGIGGTDVTGGIGGTDVTGGIGGTDVTGGVGALDAVGLLNLSEVAGFEPEVSGTLDLDETPLEGTLEPRVPDYVSGAGTLGLPLPSSGFRGIREEPGDVVDIDYLYDVGGESIFAPMSYAEEDEKEKGERLYVYQEGGTVADPDAVNVLTRRPGEYGRNYFTPGEFVPTGTAVGGAALDANQIQIPGYTYQRELLPEFGGPALTSTGTPTIGGLGPTALAGTVSDVGLGTGTPTQAGGFTPGETDGDADITEGTSFVDPVYDYLAGLGFGPTPQNITQTHVQDFLNSGFTLDALATALGTTASQLEAIADYSAPVETQTAGDTTATATGLSGVQSYLIGMDFGGSGRAVTADDVTAFADSGFDMADIASTLNLTVADLNAVGANAATATGLSGVQSYLIDQGFSGDGRAVTADDVTAFADSGFDMTDIASALNLTVADLNAVGVSTATSSGLSELQSYLTDQGFGGAGRDITSADIAGWEADIATQSVYTLADIASALNLTLADLNAVGASAATSSGLSELQSYLIDQGFGGSGRTITADDVAGWEADIATQSVYTLADVASALNLTVADLNAVGASAAIVESAQGGTIQGQGYYLGGPTDGMGDQIPATIDGAQPAALSDGEFVVPADVVSHLGNGNSDAGAQQLYAMLGRIREERTGSAQQGPEINPMQMMPA